MKTYVEVLNETTEEMAEVVNMMKEVRAKLRLLEKRYLYNLNEMVESTGNKMNDEQDGEYTMTENKMYNFASASRLVKEAIAHVKM